jgi:hypothetical protein
LHIAYVLQKVVFPQGLPPPKVFVFKTSPAPVQSSTTGKEVVLVVVVVVVVVTLKQAKGMMRMRVKEK